MQYYPQLATGSIAQYPIQRTSLRRTLVNAFDDGTRIRTADAGADTIAWDLKYEHLIDSEVAAITALFTASAGRLRSFTFLDPTDNLLNWSEDVTQASWKSDPLLSVTTGIADPFGGTNAVQITNTGQAPQQVTQQIAGPSGYQYCLSVYLRADQVSHVQLMASGGGASSTFAALAGSTWMRVEQPIQTGAAGDGFTVGLSLAPGVSVYLFGVQLEAQLGAGGYKKTRDRAGVYPNCRFALDQLNIEATGFNQYSFATTIICNTAG